MRIEQFIGWNDEGKKVTGSTLQQLWDRGGVNHPFRETQEWNPATQEWDTVLIPVSFIDLCV